MKRKYVYITAKEWFESTALANPLFADHKLEKLYPEFYAVNYDLRLLAAPVPTDAERDFPTYNDYRERFGNPDISVLEHAAKKSQAKNVFLNGFCQEHWEYIAPYIKNTAEILYLFKCPRIKDLSALAEFKALKCVFIFWNHSLETLWDMRNNKALTALSFLAVMKLSEISSLKDSNVEYIAFDSADNNGNRKELRIDTGIFDELPKLKHLFLNYQKCRIDY